MVTIGPVLNSPKAVVLQSPSAADYSALPPQQQYPQASVGPNQLANMDTPNDDGKSAFKAAHVWKEFYAIAGNILRALALVVPTAFVISMFGGNIKARAADGYRNIKERTFRPSPYASRTRNFFQSVGAVFAIPFHAAANVSRSAGNILTRGA